MTSARQDEQCDVLCLSMSRVCLEKVVTVGKGRSEEF